MFKKCRIEFCTFFADKEDKPIYVYDDEMLVGLGHLATLEEDYAGRTIIEWTYSSGQYFVALEKN